MLVFFHTCLVIEASFQQLCKTQCGRIYLTSECMTATDAYVTHLRSKVLSSLDFVALATDRFVTILIALR